MGGTLIFANSVQEHLLCQRVCMITPVLHDSTFSISHCLFFPFGGPLEANQAHAEKITAHTNLLSCSIIKICKYYDKTTRFIATAVIVAASADCGEYLNVSVR